MRAEEDLLKLRQEQKKLQEGPAQRDERIAHLQQRVQALEVRLVKASHNAHLPPSWDRFVRQPMSLCQECVDLLACSRGHVAQSSDPSFILDYLRNYHFWVYD